MRGRKNLYDTKCMKLFQNGVMVALLILLMMSCTSTGEENVIASPRTIITTSPETRAEGKILAGNRTETGTHPKFEMRGAWLTTVVNLDWPSSRNLTSGQQKDELIIYLDELKKAGINAVFFQVRAEADAFYPSPYEPWSYWLTDRQGAPPHPYYDPLEFVIEEAHIRGMELHAWLNPYRAHRALGSYPQHETHIMSTRPEWVLTFKNGSTTYTMLNPGLQDVRDFVANIVVDIVRRYNVDGIHFDDYFYPYAPAIDKEDATLFEMSNRGFTDVGDWRRDNVKLMVKQVRDSIASVDPMVKYGLSPFGIRKNADAGTFGMEGYHRIYADPVAWLQDGIVDYIAPQLYWNTTHEQAPFAPLLNYWAKTAKENNRHFYVGLAPYRVLPPHNWSIEEFDTQIKLTREDASAIQGSIFFRSQHILDNPKGINDSLVVSWFRHPALVPSMNWKEANAADPVENLRYTRLSEDFVQLNWSASANAQRYGVYRFNSDASLEFVLTNLLAENLIHITGKTEFMDVTNHPGGAILYAITSINRNSEESIPQIIRLN